jgi:hypothetical protein
VIAITPFQGPSFLQRAPTPHHNHVRHATAHLSSICWCPCPSASHSSSTTKQHNYGFKSCRSQPRMRIIDVPRLQEDVHPGHFQCLHYHPALSFNTVHASNRPPTLPIRKSTLNRFPFRSTSKLATRTTLSSSNYRTLVPIFYHTPTLDEIRMLHEDFPLAAEFTFEFDYLLILVCVAGCCPIPSRRRRLGAHSWQARISSDG